MSDIIRRDPRTEWIMRNRLHPLHDSVMSAGQAEVRGPTGLLRKNLHNVGFIGPNGIKRIDRANASSGAMGNMRRSASAQDVQLPLHTVANPDFYIMVVADMVGGRLNAHDKDILGLAHKLVKETEGTGAVTLVAFGEMKDTALEFAGVDRLMHFDSEEYADFAPEARLAALVEVNKTYTIKHWLFPDSVNGSTDLACRFSARLGERAAAQAWQVDTQQTVCRGASGSLDITRETPRILMLLEECGFAIDETRHEVLPMQLDEVQSNGLIPQSLALQNQGQIAVDPNAIPLAEAEFILSAGNGIHNWSQFHQAAEVLGATEGASRVAVDDGFMPRMRQVGASGTWVTARVYLAVGISGAIQHMQGIGQCDKIIAINTDSNCDMVKRADLSIIDDSEAVLAQLMKLVAEFHNKPLPDEEKSHAA